MNNQNMNTPNMNPAITRRHFARALTGAGGALAFGSASPAFAAKKKLPQGQPRGSTFSGSAMTKCETKVLWDFNGCIEDRFMDRVTTHVYNGNVYVWVLLPGLKTHIVKVPLDLSLIHI